jgi:nucleotide-binding universal stress UspA family protein
MFNRILVPLDGSQLSEAALPAAAALAGKLGAAVTLLHVIERAAPLQVHNDRHLSDAEEARTYLKDVARRAFPRPIPVTWHVHDSPVEDVVRSIVDHATELQPDLIVMCTHGRSGVRGLLYGTIAQQVVAQGNTPLLLVKPASPPFKLERLLVPLDPGSLHDVSLPAAEELARAYEAELYLFSVIPTLGTLGGDEAAAGTLLPATAIALLELREENTRVDLQRHLDVLRASGLRAVAESARGDPAPAILQAAERTGADLIVLSTHRRAGASAFWARSVAPKVANRALVPILLIPLDATADRT